MVAENKSLGSYERSWMFKDNHHHRDTEGGQVQIYDLDIVGNQSGDDIYFQQGQPPEKLWL